MLQYRVYMLAAALFSAAFPAIAQPIVFAAPEDVFSVVGVGGGCATRSPPFLDVTLSRAALRSTTRTTHAPQHVVAYRLGLAHWKSKDEWEVVRWSQSTLVDLIIKHADTIGLQPTTVAIPIDGLQNLSGTWLVFEVQINENGQIGTTYSRTEPLAQP